MQLDICNGTTRGSFKIAIIVKFKFLPTYYITFEFRESIYPVSRLYDSGVKYYSL